MIARVLALLIVVVTCSGQTKPAPGEDKNRFALQLSPTSLAAPSPADELSSELEKVALEEMKASGIPGAAIGIVSGDKILLAKGFGIASVENGLPVPADTLFRLGSTTKMFTAALLVQMALDGKIDLHKPIGQYVKRLDPTIAKVTVDQLLSHTAGLRDDDPPSDRADEGALGSMSLARGPHE